MLVGLLGGACNLPLEAQQEAQDEPQLAAISETQLPAQAPRSLLFESRFGIDASGQADLSVLQVCPSVSSKKPSRYPIILQSQPILVNSLDNRSNPLVTTRLKADKVPENSQNLTRLEGHVSMLTEKSLLKADLMISDNQKQTLVAIGNVSVETSESLLTAKKFEGDQKTRQTKLSDVQFNFFSNNANGQAESIKLDIDNVATLSQLTFSTCPTQDESWRFSADELKLDQNSGRGEAWGMWLKVKGIPVFYFPYLNFPIDDQRKSGILPPAISSGGRNGFDLSLPIYWNIAPPADATFKLRNIANRGTQIGAEFRYLNKLSVNRFAVEWLGKDQYTRQLLLEQPNLADGLYGLKEDRWAISLSNESYFNNQWSASFNASKVSDRDYFKDLGADLINKQGYNGQSQLVSRGQINYQDDIWHFVLMAESTQALSGTEPYRLLPSVISDANYYDTDSGILWQFDGELSSFSHSNASLIDGSRLNLTPKMSYPIRRSYAWLTPQLSYQMSQYNQNNPLTGDNVKVNRNLPIFSLDSGLIFDRSIKWGESSLNHSFEPRLFYAYVPYREQSQIQNFDTRIPDASFQQLWRANRFVGMDKIGDTNHFSLAVSNRFSDTQSGDQRLSFSMGRRFYLEQRHLALTGPDVVQNDRYSPWMAEVNFQPNNKLEISSFIEWSDVSFGINQHKGTNLARTRIKFEPKRDHIVNLSHRVRNKDGFSNEEIDFSFAWPVNDRWRIVGRWYNDLKRGRTAESLIGFEYESCCWALSIVSRRYLDTLLDANGLPVVTSSGLRREEFNSGIQLQFVFKGLGSAGQNGVSKLLESSIRDYRMRF
ncbi:MAG: LPS assembly protein LptD [Enterobacterales bacterium]|nr:LPS assembly protein LptD [Enterobacterales bacterium]